MTTLRDTISAKQSELTAAIGTFQANADAAAAAVTANHAELATLEGQATMYGPWLDMEAEAAAADIKAFFAAHGIAV